MKRTLMISVAVTIFQLLIVTPSAAGRNDCGQPVSTGAAPTASDALYTLRAGIGSAACDVAVCDVDGNCAVSATDALALLRSATGQKIDLKCAQGCFGSTTSTSSTLPYVSTTSTTLAPAATWTEVLDVFAFNGCTAAGCHGSSTFSGGLSDLGDYDAAYELLSEGVECASSSLGLRVLPGNPAASFLVAKLDGFHDCGSDMPVGGEPLSDYDLAVIVSWIESGALKN